MKKILSTLSVLLLTLAASAQCSITAGFTVTPGSAPLSASVTNTSTITGTVPSTAFIQTTFHYYNGTTALPLNSTANITVAFCGMNMPFVLYMQVIDSTSSGPVVLCTDSAMHYVTIPCAPCYTTVSKSYGASGSGTVTFTATTSAGTPGMTYNWNFGDGNTGTGSPVTHTYTTGNTNYIVTLIAASTSAGCTDTATTNAQIGNINTNAISGIIITDSNATNTDSLMVWLIKQYSILDSITMTTDTFLVAVDSTIAVGWIPGITPYEFSNKPAGNYMVKAKLLGSPTSGTGYVPTYHYSSLYWSGATTFYHSGGTSFGKNILMQIGTLTSGPGFVGGNVALGANKGTSSGIPDMLIFLRNVNGNLISSTYTDANGNYSFNNIAVGAYSIYPENMSYNTTPSTVVVSSATPTANSVNFRQSDKMMTITPVTTGIADVNANNGMAIYPNPANSQLFIATSNMDTKAMVVICNITGSKVMEAQVGLKNGIGSLNISNLQAGQYFISVESGKGRMTQKLLIEK